MSHIPLSDARWDAILRDFRNSQLTHTEFCRRRGISLHTFRKRLYQAPTPKHIPADERSADTAAPHFVPVAILPDPTPASAAHQQPLELILPNGHRIAVAPGFD